jgi:hypothetical protein
LTFHLAAGLTNFVSPNIHNFVTIFVPYFSLHWSFSFLDPLLERRVSAASIKLQHTAALAMAPRIGLHSIQAYTFNQNDDILFGLKARLVLLKRNALQNSAASLTNQHFFFNMQATAGSSCYIPSTFLEVCTLNDEGILFYNITVFNRPDTERNYDNDNT